MSIFKESFTPEIRKSLETRQNAIRNRDKNSIIYLNTRNAWIKMSSSVNTYSKKAPSNPNQEDLLNEANYDDTLARQYILKGGILNNNKLKSGIGDWNNAYSNINQDELPYQRGIRPIPGINSIDIKSKSAYGSLREVVVNFQCWDIKQLEDLELLYMRPGYSVLIEWGWTPYLSNDNKLESTISTYDFFGKTKPKEKIWEELFDKSNKSGGNYDAMFGIIKNYNWSARPDGGYDCTTTIISIGEILESLKINYTSLSNKIVKNTIGGIFKTQINENIYNAYQKNILAGIFSELYKKTYDADGIKYDLTLFKGSKNIGTLHFFRNDLELKNAVSLGNSEDNLVGEQATKTQIYITLESLILILNEYVLLSDGKNQTSLVKLSTKERTHGKPDKKIEDLLCLTNPLQISVDPTICYIKNQNWGNLKSSSNQTSFSMSSQLEISRKVQEYINTPLIQNPPNYNTLLDNIEKLVNDDRTSFFSSNNDIITFSNNSEEEAIKKLLENFKTDIQWRELNRQSIVRKKKTLYNLLNDGNAVGLEDDEIKSLVGPNYKALIDNDLSVDYANQLIEDQEKLEKASKQAAYLSNKNVKPFFYNDDPNSGMGVIGNIYINLQFLYSLSLSNELENTDKKEKQEIDLYTFIKSILAQISNSIGNVNNFDIHVDPIDNNIGRIIDINYVDNTAKEKAYEEAFKLELHSLNSTVRSYKFESKIFPEQTAMIAIGSQVKGGALGIDTNTLVDFNRGIIDRVIPRKEEPNTYQNQSELLQEQFNNLNESRAVILDFLGDTTGFIVISPSYDVQSASKYANALRDLINYSKSFDEKINQESNKAIIPTSLSVEMDGIGGLIIGHIFKIPDDLLPKGYKSLKGTNRKLGYAITGIGHKVNNNDWVTNIDSQFIILDKPPLLIPLNNTSNPSSNVSNIAIDIINGTLPIINPNYKFNPPKSSNINSAAKSIIAAAKDSINFSTALVSTKTSKGNLGCAAAVSIIFTRATGRKIISPNTIIYNTPSKPDSELEFSTLSLYNKFLSDTRNWRKRDNWRNAKPGDIIITATNTDTTPDKSGHVGVVIDQTIVKNNKIYYKIISNSSGGFQGSNPGTIQLNYDMISWENVTRRNPLKTAAFEYIGPFKI